MIEQGVMFAIIETWANLEYCKYDTPYFWNFSESVTRGERLLPVNTPGKIP